MRALSIRQPWAELILRGSKTIECRPRPTYVRGRIWIYAAEGRAKRDTLTTITIPDDGALPRGVLVGSVELVACRRLRPSDSGAARLPIDFDGYAWLVVHPERLAIPLKPTGRPQPEFFMPFIDPTSGAPWEPSGPIPRP